MIAVNVSGAFRSVSTTKKPSTTSVTPIPTMISHAFAPVSPRNR